MLNCSCSADPNFFWVSDYEPEDEEVCNDQDKFIPRRVPPPPPPSAAEAAEEEKEGEKAIQGAVHHSRKMCKQQRAGNLNST